MTVPFHTPLDTAQQRNFGLSVPQPLAMADQVRFSQIDVLNHVNNVVYFEWFERLRIRYHQEWQLSSYDHSADSPRIVIHSGQVQYHAELRLDDVFVTTCGCTSFRTNSYTLRQQVWCNATLRASFDCVMVLLRQDGSGKYPIPEAVKQRFASIDGAQ